MNKITLSLLLAEEKLDADGNRTLDKDNKVVHEMKEVSADFYLPADARFLCFERVVPLPDGKKRKITVLEFPGSVYNVTESKKQVADLIKKAAKG